MENKKGQLTVFIIIAIILVAAIVVFFVFRGSFVSEDIPASIEPVYTTFLSCVEHDALTGIDVLESQAGYIYLPDFDPGSQHMPFSSQLNFLGNPIPYWYYVSGNNIQKEQVPSKQDMEEQLEQFIQEKINKCRFDAYYEQGFEINQGEPKATVDIRDKDVKIDLDMQFAVEKGEDNAVISNHKITVSSRLGKLYDSAIRVYEQEQDDLFLENYGVDILRMYAPVDGVELTCSPLTWVADEIFDELEVAIESNTLSLKSEGGSYSLNDKRNEYFVVDINEDIRFLNSKDWPSSFEVNPTEGAVMISKPVGTQQGLGILGFCYVPYHFVYNIKYPILVQVYDDEEIFQFPVAVVIQGNKPREPLDVDAVELDVLKLCEYKNTNVLVNTYDTRLNPVESHISYECFGETCEIGETNQGSLSGVFPQCVNGYILARADGFEDAKYLYSTTESGSADIILDKVYEVGIELKLDSTNYNRDAIINFISDESSRTVVYPVQKTVELSEGQYEVQVYIYRNSSLKIAETTYEQCIEVPKSGLGGLFGSTEEKCFEVILPSQIISNALSGGGKENYYILESELKNSNAIEINAGALPSPTSLEQLQDNYVLFEEKDLDISFK